LCVQSLRQNILQKHPNFFVITGFLCVSGIHIKVSMPSALLRVFDTEQEVAEIKGQTRYKQIHRKRESLSWLRIRSTIAGSHFVDGVR